MTKKNQEETDTEIAKNVIDNALMLAKNKTPKGDNIEELTYEDVAPYKCPYCGLSSEEHDGSGFCPGGTEEFGGRR